MFRFYRGLLFTIVVLTTMSISVHGDVTTDKNPIYTARDSMLFYFYPVSGTIVGFEDGLVKVKFQTDKKLREGMRFSVFREGKPFYHPITKELVGKSEMFIGKVEIKSAAEERKDILRSEESYLCTIIKGTPEPGDIVRITSSKIKLAFFQDKKVDWAISEVFYNSLKDSKRFDIIESYTTTYGPKELSEIAKARGAEAALMLSTTSTNGAVVLDAKLLWSEDAKVFAEIEEPLGPDLPKGLKTEDEFISIPSAKREPWTSHELVAGRLIAMGDVDGDGKRELVVSDSNNIKIYNYKEEPKEMWLIKGKAEDNHFSIDVLDVNNNGRAEIFVTSMKGEDTMSSYVLEYNPSEGYKRIWDKAPYVFRVIGKTLLMQAFTRFETYSGHVYEVVWKDGYYQRGKAINIPGGVNIYGFTFVDWQNSSQLTVKSEQDKGQLQDTSPPDVLAFDDKGYLNLYQSGKVTWSSKDSYGGFDISFDRKTYSITNPTEKWFVKGRLITIKTPRGQEVIVVKKIPFVSTVPGLGYKGAEVYSLWWDGSMMNEDLILQNIPGTITDYWVEGENLFLIARLRLSSFLAKALSGDFVKRSILYYYNLKGK